MSDRAVSRIVHPLVLYPVMVAAALYAVVAGHALGALLIGLVMGANVALDFAIWQLGSRT
jgi:hypothetical protein